MLLSQLLPAVTYQSSPQRLSFGCQHTLTSGTITCTHRPKTYRELQSFPFPSYPLILLDAVFSKGFLAWLVQSWHTSMLRQSSSKYFIIIYLNVVLKAHAVTQRTSSGAQNFSVIYQQQSQQVASVTRFSSHPRNLRLSTRCQLPP